MSGTYAVFDLTACAYIAYASEFKVACLIKRKAQEMFPTHEFMMMKNIEK